MSRLQARFLIEYSSFRLTAEFSLPTEGTIAVFGPSGSGKTTLLRCLAGLIRSPSGFLQFDNEVWQDEAKGIFVPIHRRAIGLVFQEARLFPHLSIKRNLTYGMSRVSLQHRRISLDRVVDLLGVEPFLDRRPHQLSGGEQQRVAIGRALLRSPCLLLMDEPLASLDIQRRREILPFIQRVHQELTMPIVYVSHDLSEILQLAKSLILLKEGRVAAVGPIQEIFGRLDLPGVVEPGVVGSILDTQVAAHEPEFGLSRVECFGHSLFVPHQNLPVGAPLRLHVLARDVSVVTHFPQTQTSVLNVLEATVVEIGRSRSDQYAVEVKLDVGCPLLATITRKSLHHLNLKKGQVVYAHVKAVALSQDFRE